MIIIVFILGGDESVKHRTSAHSVAYIHEKSVSGQIWSPKMGKMYFWPNLDLCHLA